MQHDSGTVRHRVYTRQAPPAGSAEGGLGTSFKEVITMKVRPSVKPMCEKCKIIKRKGRVMVICENPKHKQRQG